MGKSKDLATGETRFVNTAGDTMTGNLGIGIGSDSAQGTLDVRGAIVTSNSTTSYWKLDRDDSTGSFTINDTGANNHMIIDTSGRVTMPNQPFIDCTGSSNSSHSYSANDIITHFSTRSTPVGITLSNGRFTVPVAGRYLFNFNLYSYASSGNHYRLQILVNGNIHSYAQIEVDASMAVDAISNGYDHSVMNSSILNLSANDYVEIKTTGAIQYYRGIAHNSSSMMLLG